MLPVLPPLPVLPLLPLLLLLPHPSLGSPDWRNTSTPGVEDWGDNPVLEPPDMGEWLLGDPAILTLGEEVHMFCNEVFHGILHFTASINSPTNFTRVGTAISFPGAVRPSVLLVGSTLHLYYEQYTLSSLFRSSNILLRTARVVMVEEVTWLEWEGDSSTQLAPLLAWEQEGTARVGNPAVFPSGQGWAMYYSASSTMLEDSGIEEPLYLGLARADQPTGPWTRVSSQPLHVQETGIPGHQIVGIGSLKLLPHMPTSTSTSTTSNTTTTSPLFALCNRITRDEATNRTGSTISLVTSASGLAWEVVVGPLITPESTDPTSWKQAYVYGFDTMVEPGAPDHLLVFYNARDGWRGAREAVGVTRIQWTAVRP